MNNKKIKQSIKDLSTGAERFNVVTGVFKSVDVLSQTKYVQIYGCGDINICHLYSEQEEKDLNEYISNARSGLLYSPGEIMDIIKNNRWKCS